MLALRYERNIKNIPPCVIALGFFDGVHIAHRTLLASARALADELSLPLAVFTFFSESRELKSSSLRLYSTEEKLELLSECKVDLVLLADFSELKNISGEDFVKQILVNELQAKAVAAGYNFTYGKGGNGNIGTLEKLLLEAGAICLKVDEERLDGKTLSTTYIRSLLDERRLREATAALGKPYFLSGEVIRGKGLGHKLGMPTVNISLDQGRYNLKSGVYATAAELKGELYLSITNIGTCPTFGERELHAETEIFGFDGDLYGERIRIYFLDYLREEKAFKDEKELLMQIKLDKEAVIRFENEVSWQELGLK